MFNQFYETLKETPLSSPSRENQHNELGKKQPQAFAIAYLSWLLLSNLLLDFTVLFCLEHLRNTIKRFIQNSSMVLSFTLYCRVKQNRLLHAYPPLRSASNA